MSQKANHWPTIVVDSVLSGTRHPLVTDHIDELLQWLSSTDTRGSRRLQKAFVRRPVAPPRAMRLATEYIDKAYIGYHDNPWIAFGLEKQDDISEEEVRLRYRRLIRVFHPDRGYGDSDWLAARSEKINHAYRRLVDQGVQPTDSYNTLTGEFVDLAQFETEFVETPLLTRLKQLLIRIISHRYIVAVAITGALGLTLSWMLG